MNSRWYTQSDWRGTNWYRVTGSAGHCIVERSPGSLGYARCGTYYPGYIASGYHPRTPGQTNTAKVCFHGWYSSSSYYWDNSTSTPGNETVVPGPGQDEFLMTASNFTSGNDTNNDEQSANIKTEILPGEKLDDSSEMLPDASADVRTYGGYWHSCRHSLYIKITNCKAYYVYYLKQDLCGSTYCTE